MARGAVIASVIVCSVVAVETKTGTCPLADLQRARERVPRNGWKGSDFAHMSAILTARLRDAGHRVRACEQWTVNELQDLQRRIFPEASSDLLDIYAHAADRRGRRHHSLSQLEQHWKHLEELKGGSVALEEVHRDGLCHETVMWWVHHLPSPTQTQLTEEGLRIPSLPSHRHEPFQKTLGSDPETLAAVHAEYTEQVSCQQCHTGRISNPDWQDAKLPKPLPVDKAHPGRERLRACDFQNQPKCGPCDGLGGRRWGDSPEEMEPMPCKVLHGPEVAPTTKGSYPPLATVKLTGETRVPVAVRPTTPGHYMNLSGRLSLGWDGDIMRMRYDFNGFGTQISAQSLQQAKQLNVGATIGIAQGECSCGDSIAGIMHIQSFDPADPLDPLKLPANQGGADYLGRVQVTLDGDGVGQRTAIADHFMKWAFHFLVDANASSPSFGLPLRLYGPLGVRQVFHSWVIGDPSVAQPGIWKLPQGCNVTSSSCSVFNSLDHPLELIV